MTETPPMEAREVSYDALLFGRAFLFTVLGLMGAIGVVGVVGSMAEGRLPWFLVIWFGLLSLLASWWLRAVVLRLRLAGDTLTWSTATSSGSFPVTQVHSIRPLGRNISAANLAFIEVRDGRSMTTIIRKGWVPFLEALRAANPAIEVEVRWVDRWTERWPGPSGYRD